MPVCALPREPPPPSHPIPPLWVVTEHRLEPPASHSECSPVSLLHMLMYAFPGYSLLHPQVSTSLFLCVRLHGCPYVEGHAWRMQDWQIPLRQKTLPSKQNESNILLPEYFKSIISVSTSPHYEIVRLVFLFHRWENRLRESKSLAKVTELSLRVKIQSFHLDQASSPTPLVLFLLPDEYLLETNAGLMKN